MAKDFFQELKRRKVVRVAIVYGVVGWAVIEVADTVVPNLGLPASVVTLVIVLVALGLPLALVLSWMFDVGPEGVERTSPGTATVEAAGDSSEGVSAAGFATPASGASSQAAASSTPSGTRIAVLSFDDMSPERDHEYFCDGIAEEIIDSLTRVDAFSVAARTSSFAYKGAGQDVRAIGRELGVAVVLEGSVRKSGSRLRITAQLINVDDGYHLWSERYDRELDDIFRIQDDIACSVADRLSEALGVAADLPTRRRQTENAEAYELYLQGSYYWTRRHKLGITKAMECFNAALELDPDYALPHAGIAIAEGIAGFYGLHPSLEAWKRADAAADRALELDPGHPQGLTAKGFVLTWYGWDFERARELLGRAVELDPDEPQARLFHAYALITLGRIEEAAAEVEAAVRLQPHSPANLALAATVAFVGRGVERALELATQAIDADPTLFLSRYVRGMALVGAGRPAEALEDIGIAVELSQGNLVVIGIRAAAHAAAGDLEALRGDVETLKASSSQPRAAALLALSMANLGEIDAARESMELGFQQRDPSLWMIGSVPIMDGLRAHPLWREWIDRVGCVDVLA